jgi:hypothetical protein
MPRESPNGGVRVYEGLLVVDADAHKMEKRGYSPRRC